MNHVRQRLALVDATQEPRNNRAPECAPATGPERALFIDARVGWKEILMREEGQIHAGCRAPLVERERALGALAIDLKTYEASREMTRLWVDRSPERRDDIDLVAKATKRLAECTGRFCNRGGAAVVRKLGSNNEDVHVRASLAQRLPRSWRRFSPKTRHFPIRVAKIW